MKQLKDGWMLHADGQQTYHDSDGHTVAQIRRVPEGIDLYMRHHDRHIGFALICCGTTREAKGRARRMLACR